MLNGRKRTAVAQLTTHGYDEDNDEQHDDAENDYSQDDGYCLLIERWILALCPLFRLCLWVLHQSMSYYPVTL